MIQSLQLWLFIILFSGGLVWWVRYSWITLRPIRKGEIAFVPWIKATRETFGGFSVLAFWTLFPLGSLGMYFGARLTLDVLTFAIAGVIAVRVFRAILKSIQKEK